MQACPFDEAAEVLHDTLVRVTDPGVDMEDRDHAVTDLLLIKAAIDLALAGDHAGVARLLTHRGLPGEELAATTPAGSWFAYARDALANYRKVLLQLIDTDGDEDGSKAERIAHVALVMWNLPTTDAEAWSGEHPRVLSPEALLIVTDAIMFTSGGPHSSFTQRREAARYAFAEVAPCQCGKMHDDS